MRQCAPYRTIHTDESVQSELRNSWKVCLTSDELAAREIAQGVVRAGRSQSIAGDSASGASASACSYLYNELSRWIGSEGCHQLFTRALADARKESALLQSIQLTAGAVPYVQGIEAAIAEHGDAEIAAGIETMLLRLVELLGRLIGDDMAIKLITPVLAKGATGRGTPATERDLE